MIDERAAASPTASAPDGPSGGAVLPGAPRKNPSGRGVSARHMRRVARRVPLLRRIGAGLRKVLQLDDDPRAVARGAALGMFVALTPTMGVQMPVVLFVNTLFRANRLVGVAMVWILNPLTLVPIYWADYLVGRLVLRTRPVSYETFAAIFEFEQSGTIAQIRELIDHLKPVATEVAWPMLLGGVLVGTIFGLLTYPLTLAVVSGEQRGKAHVQALKERRIARQAERESRRVPRSPLGERREVLGDDAI